MLLSRRLLSIWLLLASVVYFLSPAFGQEKSLPTKLTELKDKVIDIQLVKNRYLANVTVVNVTPAGDDGGIKLLRVTAEGARRQTTVPATTIQEIYLSEQPLYVQYDRKQRCLNVSVEKREAAAIHRAEVVARLAANRHRYWKPLTPEDHERFMKTHRQFIDKVRSAFPTIPFRLVETKYFLFLTELEPAEVDGYIAYLDAMYEELCKAFGISPDKNIWCGKCVVVAFRKAATYQQFQAVVMNNKDSAGTQGLCHQRSDGTVIFSGYKGDNGGFGHVLIHETTHGFVHRYMSTARAPSWLNDGMSDWLADKIVGGKRITQRQRQSAWAIKQRGSWGDFLTTKQIAPELYGAASGMVDLLLSRDRGGQFKHFFDGIKEGKPADQSLKEGFGLSYQNLQTLYAQRISTIK